MKDLFEREQRILDAANDHLNGMRNGISCRCEEFETLTNEYGRLLKQLRRVTKISDRTTIDLNASKQDLLDIVNYDSLTGIYNRQFVKENMKKIISTLSRSEGTLGILMIDVDYFKNYNDTYGHGMGDKCLKAVAEALKESILRPDDFVARYGGEEFIAVLPNTGESGINIMAERMLEKVRSLGITHEKSKAADHVTISVGGTSCKVSHTHSTEDYIDCADKALYTSKQNGRNKYTFVDFN